eukprot:67313_2
MMMMMMVTGIGTSWTLTAWTPSSSSPACSSSSFSTPVAGIEAPHLHHHSYHPQLTQWRSRSRPPAFRIMPAALTLRCFGTCFHANTVSVRLLLFVFFCFSLVDLDFMLHLNAQRLSAAHPAADAHPALDEDDQGGLPPQEADRDRHTLARRGRELWGAAGAADLYLHPARDVDLRRHPGTHYSSPTSTCRPLPREIVLKLGFIVHIGFFVDNCLQKVVRSLLQHYGVSACALVCPDIRVMWCVVDGAQVDESGEVPRANFDTFLGGFPAVFQVATRENWHVLLYAGMRSQAGAGA